MKRYKLKKWYPSLPSEWKVGQIVEKNYIGGYSGYLSVLVPSYFLYGKEVEDNAEYWEEIIDAKPYDIFTNLKKCCVENLLEAVIDLNRDYPETPTYTVSFCPICGNYINISQPLRVKVTKMIQDLYVIL